MSNQKKREDLSPKIKIVLDKAIQKIIAEEKARYGHLVVSDNNGNIKKYLQKIYKLQIFSKLHARCRINEPTCYLIFRHHFYFKL